MDLVAFCVAIYFHIYFAVYISLLSKNKYGMGLGIFIAKNLIENIEGSIFCKNQKDGGASVEIIIIRDTST